jgi:hypothetical protein
MLFKTHYLQNRFMNPIAVTSEQHAKAAELHNRFGGTHDEWLTRHFWTEGDMILSVFGNMTIGILPDGSSHS